jgi:hypothetical protein
VVEQEEPKYPFHAVTIQSRGGGEPEQPGSPDLVRAAWRKSSWSTYNGNCVEVANLQGNLVGVRDTKDAGAGPVLLFTSPAWRSFVARIKNREHA